MEHQVKRTTLQKEKAAEVRLLYKKNKEKLEDYIDRILWWNNKINLVSRDVPRETVAKHVEHSLVIAQSFLFRQAEQVVDSGTGGGLPGIPLAIVAPEKEVLLNDIVSKKIMACKHMVSGLDLNKVSTASDSVKELRLGGKELIVSKHAFKINDLIAMLRNKPWSGIILLKGGNEVENEIGGVDEPLSVEVIDLEPGFEESFYSGKAMVEISRKEER